MKVQDRVNFGILGCSNNATQKILPAIHNLASLHVAAVASRDLAKAGKTAAQFSIPKVYGSYEELLADSQIDAVYISLPNSLHCEWTIAAAKAGKHVICEKPAALSEAEALEMTTACRDNKVLLMEGFMYKFHPQHQWVRQIIDNGDLGEIRFIHAAFCYMLQARHSPIRLVKELGGGALTDTGCYCLSMARWMLGTEPMQAKTVSIKAANAEVESRLCAILEFPKGPIATITCALDSHRLDTCSIVGARGMIELEHAFVPTETTRVFFHNEAGQVEGKVFAAVNQFALEFSHFADCVAGKQKLLAKPEDIVGNAGALEMIRTSIA